MTAALVNPQSPIDNADDWLPIDEVASHTRDSVRTLRFRCGRWQRDGLARKAPPRSGKGKGVWWINRAADPRLSRHPTKATREELARPALLEQHPAHLVDLAYRKAHWLRAWREAVRDPGHAGRTERQVAKRIAAEARKVEGGDFKISARSLQAWHAAYSQIGDGGQIAGVAALVPRWNNGGESRRGGEAIDYFYALYHSPSRHSVRVCHDTTLREARKQGWPWPSSYAATCRWLRENDQLAESCLHREGQTAYSKRFMPYQEIDWTTIEPGHWYVCDHTQVDFWCLFDGKPIRGWLTAILDCRSRCVVGWHFGDAPHQDAILAALRMAFTDWAVCEKIRIDNGKDFCSQLITGVTKRERDRYRRQLGPDWQQTLRHQREVFFSGVLGELDITVIYALPYHGWSKGIVERWYGTFNDQCSRAFVTYTGNNPLTRPECVKEHLDRGTVPPIEDARVRIGEFVELYHRTPHRGLDGESPLDVWSRATRLRRAGESELVSLMQSRGVYRVGANGVSFRVGGRTLSFGQASPALSRMKGRDVFITLDPADCSCCYAYTADPAGRVFIARLSSNDRIPADATIDQVREANKRRARRDRVTRKAATEAAKRSRSAAQEIAAMQREKLSEARATGTDGRAATANIVPVRTGFEGVSTALRARLETAHAAPPEPDDLDDLFDDETDVAAVDECDDDLDDLGDLDVFFSDDEEDSDGDDPLDGFL